MMVAGLIVASFIIFGTPKRKPNEPVQWTIYDYYDHVSRKIHEANTMDKILDARPLVDGFYNKEYRVKPSNALRRSLRKSLLQAFDRKINDLAKTVN